MPFRLKEIFSKEKRILIGTVHLRPLPGSPGNGPGSPGVRPGSPGVRPGSPGNGPDMDAVLEAALADASAWARGGADGLIVENFGDAPFYPGRVPPHTTAFMALIANEVREKTALPLGINVLRNDGMSALGAALAAGASFIRVNVFTGAVATDQGIIEGEAHRLIRYRDEIGSSAAILADVHVKHGRPLHSDDIARSAREAAERGRADGLIVTGTASGAPPAAADLEAVRNAVPGIPLIAGSGLDPGNAAAIMDTADAAIVGTWCKKGGDISAPVDEKRVAELVRAVRAEK